MISTQKLISFVVGFYLGSSLKNLFSTAEMGPLSLNTIRDGIAFCRSIDSDLVVMFYLKHISNQARVVIESITLFDVQENCCKIYYFVSFNLDFAIYHHNSFTTAFHYWLSIAVVNRWQYNIVKCHKVKCLMDFVWLSVRASLPSRLSDLRKGSSCENAHCVKA